MKNFGYHFARWEGDFRRKTYQALLPVTVGRTIPSARPAPLEVYSYSSEEMLPEQVRSIRSFLRYVGRPNSFTVVSDGSHSARSIALLQKIDPAVAVRSIEDYLPSNLPEKFRHYVTTHPTGKQLGLTMSLPRGGPALYADADVLFFRGARNLLQDLNDPKAPALYLRDCKDSSADMRILRGSDETRAPVNCGLLILFQPLDWSLGIQRFLELEGEPSFFTNQTIVHLVMHANGAQPLDTARYNLQLDDQFIYPDIHAGPELVLRHYVNPVRHKFWMTP